MSSSSAPKPSTSVLTPTIPGREWFLREAKASVRAQTTPCEHLVLLDDRKAGCARTVNRLAEEASGVWLLILADDDLLLPACLELLLSISSDVDVVYSPPLVWGEPPEQFCQAPPVIPSLALIRTTTWRNVGGYGNDLVQQEDRDLWTRLLAQGARFARYDRQPTWVYRLAHGGNKSRR